MKNRRNTWRRFGIGLQRVMGCGRCGTGEGFIEREESCPRLEECEEGSGEGRGVLWHPVGTVRVEGERDE